MKSFVFWVGDAAVVVEVGLGFLCFLHLHYQFFRHHFRKVLVPPFYPFVGGPCGDAGVAGVELGVVGKEVREGKKVEKVDGVWGSEKKGGDLGGPGYSIPSDVFHQKVGQCGPRGPKDHDPQG